MAAKSMTTRLAHGSFGVAVMAFFGPSLHSAVNGEAPGAGNAVEGCIAALMIGTMAITLAIVTLRRFRHEKDQAGIGWARSALTLAGVAVVLWGAVLVFGSRA